MDDRLEHEADQMAEMVVSGSAAGAVQRKCAACEEAEMHCSPAELPAEDEEENLQTKRSAGAAPEVSPKTASRIASFRGSGKALSPAARSYFEPRFGHDLSAVRLHTGAEAARAAGEVAARAFAVGEDVAFAAGEYQPESPDGRRLLAHELAHTVQQRRAERRLQRNPLSDSVAAAWTAEPTLEALLARLSQADVQGAPSDADVDAEVAHLLAGRADDLWVAQRVRQGMLGRTAGAVARPIQAFFFRGATEQRALVIAGVHGTERQGIEVAQMLINDLQTRQPHFTMIVVPSLFPDTAASGRFGSREGATPTNRNFPQPSKDLAAARAAGSGTPIDALGRSILPENLFLLELIERFQPERIISIHGTFEAGSAGVFYDPRSLRSAEVEAARQWAAEKAYTQALPRTQYTSEGQEELREEIKERLFKGRLAELRQQASDVDRALSLTAATQIDTATAGISGRGDRDLTRGRDDLAKAPELAGRKAHPSVAGNVGPTGALKHASWSGSVPGGVSLGGYAPPRGMSVFTVEPPINRNTADYPTTLDKISAADRKIELQSYADAVRTVLLGAP